LTEQSPLKPKNFSASFAMLSDLSIITIYKKFVSVKKQKPPSFSGKRFVLWKIVMLLLLTGKHRPEIISIHQHTALVAILLVAARD
jgi:hypothetical protein